MKNEKSPRLFLAVDNCFASKRWTEPEDWMALLCELGIRYAEASADTECDPLYTTPEYLANWRQRVQEAGSLAGVRVANLYSGHGTYSTLGLSHADRRVRAHLRDNWLKPFLSLAQSLEAGVGFYCFAFNRNVLQSYLAYNEEVEALCEILGELSHYNRFIGGKTLSVEQMYAPHQYPWTIEGALYLMKHADVKITLDTGHHTGQKRFLPPSEEALFRACRPDGGDLWVGTDVADALLRSAQNGSLPAGEAVKRILDNVAENKHLFSAPQDGDLYAWLERLGCNSPIIHLQQTDGNGSSHRGFTAELRNGDQVCPKKVLRALARAYGQPGKSGKSAQIFLTLELFFPTAAYPSEIIRVLRESVAVWRSVIPYDGITLEQALENL